jgi:glutathione peroxidase
MKTINLIFSLILSLMISSNLHSQNNSFYNLSADKIGGEILNFSELKGKKVLIVNTASKCGLTPQYEELQELYEEYGGDDFIIIGFPANDFLKQEPGTDEEIKAFCSINYGVTFQMMSKITVKGDEMHPVYQWLTEESKNGVMDSSISWNFQKYLIDESGNLVKMLSPKTSPKSEEVITWLTKPEKTE